MPELTTTKNEMKKQERKPSIVCAFLIYAVFLYGFWACKEIWIDSAMEACIPEGVLLELLKGILKTAVWTVPALFLVHRYQDEVFVGLREMFTTKPPLKTIVISFLIYTLASFPLRDLIHGSLSLDPDFHFSSSLWLLFVGITEEGVFRGWMLNATAKKMDEKLALGLNAVMFLAIHFPKWITEGMFVSAFTGFGFISIILFSLVTGYIFLKTKNIMLPVLLHMWYDFMLEIF